MTPQQASNPKSINAGGHAPRAATSTPRQRCKPHSAPRVDRWTVECLFHTFNCDVQLALGPFKDRAQADVLAAAPLKLECKEERLVLTDSLRSRCVPWEDVIVHGDLPDAQQLADFAFVNAWVFPARRLRSARRGTPRRAGAAAEHIASADSAG